MQPATRVASLATASGRKPQSPAGRSPGQGSARMPDSAVHLKAERPVAPSETPTMTEPSGEIAVARDRASDRDPLLLATLLPITLLGVGSPHHSASIWCCVGTCP